MEVKIGDTLTTKKVLLLSYDHGSDRENHLRLEVGTELIVVEISVNNTDFLTLTRKEHNDNIGLTKQDFI
jgi:hypothetical protein